jgi:beta-lactam-binding protein with PASTA domain
MKIRSILITFGLTVGVFIVGALIMNFVVMPLVIHRGSSVIVPDLRGMSEAQATQVLAKKSLELRVDREQNNAEIPKGFVMSQSPRHDESVKQGRTVSVTLSLGPKTGRIPDLKGMSLRQGGLILERQSLGTGRVARVIRSGDSREVVIACSPDAGREVPEGAEVDLLVGVGGQPRRFMMPNLEGQDLLFIKDKLEDLGFRIRNVRYEPREDVYPNTIIDQDPKPGLMIREGDSIELVAAGSG